MAQTTYSFTDLVGSIHSDVVGDFIFTGNGVGSVSVSKATERTSHDIAADGSVMISKIAGNNGTVTIETQQTSPLHLVSSYFAVGGYIYAPQKYEHRRFSCLQRRISAKRSRCSVPITRAACHMDTDVCRHCK